VDSTGLAGFAWRLAITGLGAGLVMATVSAVAVQSVPGPLAGMAGAGQVPRSRALSSRTHSPSSPRRCAMN
jgi:hypothetical protein